jgi:hypothetical protein
MPMVRQVSQSYNVAYGQPGWPVRGVDQVYKVAFMLTDTAFMTSSTTLVVGKGKYFSLADLASYASYTGVFDQYRITRVQIWVHSGITSMASESGNDNCVWSSAPDLDDSTTPTSVNLVASKPHGLCTSLFAAHYHDFSPRPALAAYSGAFTSYASPDPETWLDCASPNIQYYGLKAATNQTNAAVSFASIARVYVEFKGSSLA